MSKFLMDDRFLFTSESGYELYRSYARDLPIIDYHCHLKPDVILEDKPFRDISEIWLEKDHYKWRLMRWQGISEYYITGAASNKEKFASWLKALEYSVGNPVYYWSYMEMKMYFELDEPLNESRADELWSLLNHKLKEKNLTPKDLIHKSNVKFIGTTDRITDSLTAHEQINKSDKFKFKIIPSMRLDDAVKIQKTSFLTFLKKLCQTTKRTKIVDFDTYIQALSERICYFQQKGSMLADLGLEYLFFKKGTKEEVTNIFNKCISEGQLSQDDVEILSTEIVLSLSQILYRKKWILQLHVGAIGSINDKMLKTVGRVSGFDSINDQSNIVIPLKQMLNEMNARGGIPKLIYYNIDGTKNAAIASVLAAFQENEENIEGKLQLGSAWWYQDNRQGIEKQLLDLATQGSLGSFIGMLTDSRSFLSYARHDYFRRILCNLLGEWYDRGEFPKDKLFAKHFIEKICYTNIETYLGLRLPMNPE